MFNVSEQRLEDQVNVIQGSEWFTSIEPEEVKRRTDIRETLLKEAGTECDNKHNVPEEDLSQLPQTPEQLGTPQQLQT